MPPGPTNFDAADGWLELLAEARRGSREALGRLLQRFRPLLLHIANGEMDTGLQGKAGASDLVQQSLLEAQRDFGGFRGDTQQEVEAWLVHILQHNLLDFARQYHGAEKRAVAREAAPDSGGLFEAHDPGPSPSAMALSRESVEQLQRALPRLSEEQRRVIQMRHQEAQSFAAIGAALGKSEEAARKIWARAIDELRLYLREHHDGDAPGA